jgi:hypothetical protein
LLESSSSKDSIEHVTAETTTRRKNSAGESESQPRHVHGLCLNCGHNENFKPRWRRGETLASLAREICCEECGAEGAAGNIYLRAATSRGRQRPANAPPLDVGASILATLAWPFEMRGLLILVPPAAMGTAMVRLLERIWGRLLIGGSVMVGIAASVAVASAAVILVGAALSVPAQLVFGAVEYEYADNVRNSPKGGYRERLARDHETSRRGSAGETTR